MLPRSSSFTECTMVWWHVALMVASLRSDPKQWTSQRQPVWKIVPGDTWKWRNVSDCDLLSIKPCSRRKLLMRRQRPPEECNNLFTTFSASKITGQSCFCSKILRKHFWPSSHSKVGDNIEATRVCTAGNTLQFVVTYDFWIINLHSPHQRRQSGQTYDLLSKRQANVCLADPKHGSLAEAIKSNVSFRQLINRFKLIGVRGHRDGRYPTWILTNFIA